MHFILEACSIFINVQSHNTKSKSRQTESLEARSFLSALADGGTFSEDYRTVYGMADRLQDSGDAGAVSYQNELRRFVSSIPTNNAPTTGAHVVAALLQIYTDEWLQTGISADGQERPFERKLTEARAALVAVAWYEVNGASVWIDWNGGVMRHPASLTERLRVVWGRESVLQPARLPLSLPSGLRLSLSKQLALPKSVQPVRRTPTFWDEVGRSYSPISTQSETDRGLVPASSKAAKTGTGSREHLNMPSDVEEAALLRAIILFHAFMKAPWRHRLGKCKRCRDYFVLKVNPPKAPYIRGMHCEKCKGKASAEASGKSNRATREKELLALAARAYASWRPIPGIKERKEWVAIQVNKQRGTKEIQRNWVTRHEAEICELAKRATDEPLNRRN